MSSEYKHGNDLYWTFLEEIPSGREIGIYQKLGDEYFLLAKTFDKYSAMAIVNALIAYKPDHQNTLSKKELAFLDFVKAYCPEPYSTMAMNAIMWNDKESYKKLRNDFPVIYS
jgi:hypothetical protein